MAAWWKPVWRLPGLLVVLIAVHGLVVIQVQREQRQEERSEFQGAVRVLEQQVEPDRVRLLLQDEGGRLLRVAAYGERASGLDGPWQGQCLQVQLRLRPPGGVINWVGFDYARWLYARGIDALGTVHRWQPCSSTPIQPGAMPQAMAPLTPGEALLRALVFADRSGFDSFLWNTLARTGVSHLFAISGLHLGLLGAWGWFIGRMLWAVIPGWQLRCRRQRVASLAAALAMSAYMGLAAGQVSAWRAWMMGMVVLGLLGLGRRPSLASGWSLALLGVLLIAPLQSLHAAFWLSFGAVLFLLAAWPWLQGQSWLRRLVMLQVGLGLGLAPLCWAWFGQWSLVGLLLNLVLVPAMALLLPAGLLAACLQVLGWSAPQAGMVALLDRIYRALEDVAEWPAAVWTVHSLTWVEAVGLVAGLVMGLALCWPHARRLGVVLLIWLAMLGLAMRPPSAPEPGAAEVWVLDVGQGSAAVIRTAGHWLVIDSGPRSPTGRFDAGAMVVLPHLQALGAHRIDVLVTTHEDLDHAGGRGALAAAMPVGAQWGEAGQDCRREQRWAADGVILQSLWLARAPGWSRNNQSCVLLLDVAGVRMLFPGDIEVEAERSLMDHPALRSGVDVVLVPHHGSETSSSQEWVEQLQPPLAIVPAGAHNRWGFPRAKVIQRWEAAGSRVLSTAEGGAIHLSLPSRELRRPPARSWRPEPL